MKLICTKDNFKKAVLNSERIVSKQTTLPILNNILFEAKQSNLKISATNLEIGVLVQVGAKVEKEGSITIPAKTISGFINNLPTESENIVLETSEQNLKITSGSLKAIIKGLSAEEFPLIPQKKTDFLFSIPNNTFKEMLLKILPCVAFNETRQELTGVNIILNEKEVLFAATDSFRLAESKFTLQKNSKNESIYDVFIKKVNNLIVPANTLTEILRIISNEDGDVLITIEEGQIFFEINGTIIVSRLINGKYPEYQHIIPADFKTRIVKEKEAVQSAVKMASVFTLGKSGEVVLETEEGGKKIIISAKNAEVGENSSEIKADITGPCQKVVFNPRYLLDGLNAINTSKLAIFINNETSPVAVKEINEKIGEVLKDYIYIVMPIKN